MLRTRNSRSPELFDLVVLTSHSLPRSTGDLGQGSHERRGSEGYGERGTEKEGVLWVLRLSHSGYEVKELDMEDYRIRRGERESEAHIMSGSPRVWSEKSADKDTRINNIRRCCSADSVVRNQPARTT